MHEPDAPVERLVYDRPVHAWDQVLEEGDGGGPALGGVGRVVDVVRGDVGQVGGRGVLEDVELVDEVEEDGVLLARGGGLGGAEWRLGRAGAVPRYRCWGGEGDGESGEGEGEEGGEVHGCVVRVGGGRRVATNMIGVWMSLKRGSGVSHRDSLFISENTYLRPLLNAGAATTSESLGQSE